MQKRNLVVITLAVLFFSCAKSDLAKGATCLELGDYKMAQMFFRRLLEDRPDNVNARIGLGKALLQNAAHEPANSELWHDALVQLEAARVLDKSDSVALLLSHVYTEQARYSLATGDTLTGLEQIKRSLQYNNNSIEVLNLAGIVYFRSGQSDKARVFFERALGIDSADVATLFNNGMICWQNDQFRQAHRFWKKALSRSPDDQEIVYWYARAEKLIRERGTAQEGILQGELP